MQFFLFLIVLCRARAQNSGEIDILKTPNNAEVTLGMRQKILSRPRKKEEIVQFDAAKSNTTSSVWLPSCTTYISFPPVLDWSIKL